MTGRKLKILQITLFIFIVFSIHFSIQASKPKEIVVIEYDKNKSVLDSLYDKGYIKNVISLWTLKAISKITGKEIEAGAFAITDGMSALALHSQLINPEYRYVEVGSGLRKEQIANIYGSELEWGEEKINEFSKQIEHCAYNGGEGYFSPGVYLVHHQERVSVVQKEMRNELNNTFKDLQRDLDKDDVNMATAVTIASLIEKESGGVNDMRLISGIIWNRLDKGMPLQIDATLQYAKGNEDLWWPRVKSDYKYIDSPYNTYQNDGLPPTPIANPSKASLAAAINPLETSCIFYIHDKRGNIHCSSTYTGHKRNINNYLK